MPSSSEGLHEARSALSPEAQDKHRARVSLNEELEAIDWYDQRIEASHDEELRKILKHNRDEETEHAMMLIDWLRKHDSVLDGELLARGATKAGKHHEGGDQHAGGGTKHRAGKRGELPVSHLRRHDAPFGAAVWQRLDEEAAQAFDTYRTTRKLVEVEGPHGWEKSAVSLGRVRAARADGLDVDGLELQQRRVQPLIELRVPFAVPRIELDAIERGAEDPELDAVVDACRRIAVAEDRIVFYGLDDAAIRGIAGDSPHAPIALPSNLTDYPAVVAEATERLRLAGVSGPYSIVLGPRWYDALARTTGPGGYPILEHLQRLLEGPPIWSPALEGGVVISRRGGDYRLVLGEDAVIGYRGHDAEHVHLYVEESMTFRALAPEASVWLKSS
jgi:uncharacterized linocin/CFP29 family protein